MLVRGRTKQKGRDHLITWHAERYWLNDNGELDNKARVACVARTQTHTHILSFPWGKLCDKVVLGMGKRVKVEEEQVTRMSLFAVYVRAIVKYWQWTRQFSVHLTANQRDHTQPKPSKRVLIHLYYPHQWKAFLRSRNCPVRAGLIACNTLCDTWNVSVCICVCQQLCVFQHENCETRERLCDQQKCQMTEEANLRGSL